MKQHKSLPNCLVTGGGGFIGSHLVEKLLALGHEVTVLDNFSSGRRENLAAVVRHDSLRVIEADVANFAGIRSAFEGAEWVFHLAALADVVPSIERPLDYHRANVDGTVAVLEAARLCGVKRFVYAASSSCYGMAEIFPTPESAPIRPPYPYALTKVLGEQCVFHWAQVYKLPALSLRFFNVYGPRARTTGTYGAVLGVFLAQKLAKKPLTVVGDGLQTRDFVHVEDIAEALILAGRSQLSGEAFNVGTGNPQSILRIAELLGGEKIHLPKRPGEPERTQADIAKISRLLGWKPRVRFEDGIAAMLARIESWKDAPVWTPEAIDTATRQWFSYLGKADRA